MYRVKNTAEDRSKSLLHRTAPKFELEPMLCGRRVQLRGYVDITDEQYAANKATLDVWVKNGMVDVIDMGSEGKAPPVVEDSIKWVAKEEMGEPVINATSVAKLEFAAEELTPVPSGDELTATLEPAGATEVVEEVPVAPAPEPEPVVEEKTSDTPKKSYSKKKLF